MITAAILTLLEWIACLLPDAWLYRLARNVAPDLHGRVTALAEAAREGGLGF